MGKANNKRRNIISKPEHTSIAFWAVMVFVVMFLFVAPFYKGLFNGGQFMFERPIYTTVVWSAVALFAVAIHLFSRWKLESHRDLMSLLIWIIPLFYLISLFNAASHHLAVNQLYIHVTCVVFFLIGAYFMDNKWGATIIQYALVGSGYVLVIYGFLNWFGNAHYQDAVLGMRLSGAFQYPNSFATYLTGLLVACLVLVSYSKKWYMIAGHALMLVPIILSIFLTLSRGGLVILPVVILIYFIFQPWRQQIFALLYLMLAGVASLSLFNTMTKLRQQLNEGFDSTVSSKGWLWLIAVSVVVAAITYVIHHYMGKPIMDRSNVQKVFHSSNFWIPAGLVASGVVLSALLIGNNGLTSKLPSGIQKRLESISIENRSIASRVVFIEDSIKIAKDYPIFGAGGGAWNVLYNQYKSFPYTSNQTHTVFLQYLVETGFVGLGIFAFIILYMFVMYVRGLNQELNRSNHMSTIVLPFMSIAILSHSMIDFDMSFVYLSAIVFLGLGTMASLSATFKLPAKTTLTTPQSGKIVSGAIVCIAIVVFIFGAMALQADSNFKKAMHAAAKTQNYDDIKGPLDSSLKLSQNHPDYTLYKIQIMMQLYEQSKDDQFIKEAEGLLQRLHRSEPNNRRMIDMQYALLINRGDYEQALSWISYQLNRYSWDIGLYEKAMALNMELGKLAGLQGSPEQQSKYWMQSLRLMDRFADKQNESSKYNHKFRITPTIALTIGQIYFMQGDYKQASETLAPHRSLKFEIADNRVIARWYLASLMKQNKNDKILFKTLIEKYPEEEARINNILSEKFH